MRGWLHIGVEQGGVDKQAICLDIYIASTSSKQEKSGKREINVSDTELTIIDVFHPQNNRDLLFVFSFFFCPKHVRLNGSPTMFYTLASSQFASIAAQSTQ